MAGRDRLFVYGIGTGFATAQATNVVLADVPPPDAGAASGAQSAVRQLGSALGIALPTTVHYTAFSTRLNHALKQLPHTAPGLSGAIVSSGGATLPALAAHPGTAALAQAGHAAMSSSVSLASYLAAGLLGRGLLATAFIRGPQRSEPDSAEREAAAPRPTASTLTIPAGSASRTRAPRKRTVLRCPAHSSAHQKTRGPAASKYRACKHAAEPQRE